MNPMISLYKNYLWYVKTQMNVRARKPIVKDTKNVVNVSKVTRKGVIFPIV